MKARNNRSGFTLLEIIIVIIIVGVLASLALPRLFSTVEFSRSTAALTALGLVRASIERCSAVDNSIADCVDIDELDVEDPGETTGSNFSYAITDDGPDPEDRNYTITATRLANDGGNAGDTIYLEVVNTGATTGITRGGTGAFVNIH